MGDEKILVIGLGNPILGDDGIGWHILGAVKEAWESSHDSVFVEFEALAVGGLTLMEHMQGYSRALVLDALVAEDAEVGGITELPLAEACEGRNWHLRSAHDTSLAMAMEVGRRLGIQLPDVVWVIGVNIWREFEFSEMLSPRAAGAIENAKARALARLHAWMEERG